MNWKSLTVSQYQQIYEVANMKLADEDASVKLLAILTNKTEDEVNELPLKDFNEQAAKLSFLFTKDIPGNAKHFIRAGKHKYNLIYDISEVKQRQYAEVKFYIQGGIIENLHNIVASIVRPVKFLSIKDNKAEDVQAYATDLLQARFIDVYHSAVFFCRLYKNSMTALKTYLVEEMSLRMTRETAEKTYQTLIRNLDGFITPPL